MRLVPLAGLEPAHPRRATDFESVASTIPPQRHIRLNQMPKSNMVKSSSPYNNKNLVFQGLIAQYVKNYGYDRLKKIGSTIVAGIIHSNIPLSKL